VGRMAQRLGAATAGSDLQEGDRVNTVPLVPESENGEART
jgi:hypothetical protein